jgi:cytolysin-activating lysine-acyltransferase
MNPNPSTPAASISAEQLESAKKELTKLPLLGPAMWLYARDAQRRFTFIADMDWRLMPPLVLDQCRLFSKADMPWAFVTWAFVSDAVNLRLGSTSPVIAPHEWKSGEHPWLIDVVAPFGDVETVAREVANAIAPGKPVRAWLHNAAGQPAMKELAPHV